LGVGIDLLCAVLDPAHSLRHDGGLGSFAFTGWGAPTADQRPQWLVEVRFGWLDEADIGHAGSAEPGGERDTCVASADDSDGMADGVR
jgi:hypothetical protein